MRSLKVGRRKTGPVLALSVIALIIVACGTPARRQAEISQISLEWPFPPDKPRIRFVKELRVPEDVGIRASFLQQTLSLVVGQKREYLRLPQQISIGSRGRLIVTDRSNKSIHIFDLRRKRYTKLDKFGKKRFYSPGGVAENEKGYLYVSDTITREVMVFDPGNKPAFEFGGPDMFGRPTSMAYDLQNERLYVVDTISNNIKVFGDSGNFLFQFGTRGDAEGEFNFPSYITTDQSGQVFVTDTMNHRIQIFDADGKFLRAFGKPGDAYGSFSKPKGLSVDSKGHIYVVDSLHDVVQIFDARGALLLSFCGPGSGPGQLWLPSDIVIDREDRIYVTDTYNGRIQIFDFLPEVKVSE